MPVLGFRPDRPMAEWLLLWGLGLVLLVGGGVAELMAGGPPPAPVRLGVRELTAEDKVVTAREKWGRTGAEIRRGSGSSPRALFA